MNGTNELLRVIPWWMTFAFLYVVCVSALLIGRLLFEGHGYNVSLASKYGDIALIAIVATGRLDQPKWIIDHHRRF
jgi:hypothetical protein